MAEAAEDPLEELLAAALAAFDEGGERELEAFVAAHPAHRAGLARGLQRCRQLGLLGQPTPQRDFPERLGEFRLLRRLGSGGMGVVYEAEQESLNRRVALKIVRPELLFFEGARERFRREIEAVARLAHPAVVPVLASGEQDGVPWYAMELLHGLSVHELCNRLAGRNPADLGSRDLWHVLGAHETGTDLIAGTWWQVCARIVQSLALGVRHAHLRGIVHRDIKPSNIMLTPDGRAVLLDFGVARIGGGREFTRTGNTPGSPAFMSPEQLRGDAVDERTDVYSLAATLWQMLTLVAPFADAQDPQRIRDGEPPSLRARNREVPPELELVVRTAMDRDRERRYPDVEAFAADLGAVLQRRSIHARRLGLGLRTWRWCQRHRVAATAAAAVAIAALTVPAAFAWREREVNRELQAAVTVADESFTTSLDAIDKMLVSLANDRLRFVPEAEPVTRETLEEACAMYRVLMQKHPRHERLRRDAARALARLGTMLARAGQRERAISTYREAIGALGGDRTDIALEEIDVRASANGNLAALYSDFGDREQLRECSAAALRDYEAAATLPARRSSSLFGLAQVHNLRACLPEITRDPAALDRELTAAVDCARQALAAHPTYDEYQATLALILRNRASHCLDTARAEEGEGLLLESIAIVRAMPPDAHVWPQPATILGDALDTLGSLRATQQRPDEARALLEECLALREKACTDHPEDIDLQCRLGGALHDLARLDCTPEAQDAALSLAVERLARAIEVQRRILARSPGYARSREFLMKHLRLRGNCLARRHSRTELVAIADELLGDHANANHLRATARFFLRADAMLDEDRPTDQAALRVDYRNRALAALLAAEQAGWDSRSTLTESVYDPLRDRAEFVALQGRLGERAAAAPTQSLR